MRHNALNSLNWHMKQAFDIFVVLVTAFLWGPVLVVTAFIVRTCLGSPVFFVQERPGLRGRLFKLFKFRTMREGAGTDAERLTRFGRFLRTTSLDELPEVFNVLKGDMALVGPRPLLVRYLPRYSPEQARRHEVRPGITGWAQVHGRNALSWEQKFAYDVWYVEHRSFGLDMKILWLTVRQVVSRKGISAAGETTMGEFLGKVGVRSEELGVGESGSLPGGQGAGK